MIKPRDMLQWRNLITPLIVPLLFRTALITSPVAGIFGLFSGIADYIKSAGRYADDCFDDPCGCSCDYSSAAHIIFLVSFRTTAHLYRIRAILEAAEQEFSNSNREIDLSNAA